MAPVESEIYCINKDRVLEHSIVDRGKSIPVKPYLGTTLGVFCDRLDKNGMVIVTTDAPHFVGAILFDGDLEEGQDQDINEPIVFKNDQDLVIYKEDDSREVYLNLVDGSENTRSRIRHQRRLPVKIK